MARRPTGAESEDRLIGWLRGLAGRSGARSPIGDDAAILSLGGEWAITTDSQIEGVHFPAGLDPALVARRLLAVNLSDLAASGAEPAWAFLALAVPPGFEARRFFRALEKATREAGVTLAGGDLARSPQGLVSSLTLLGRRPAGGRWLRRSAARAGDLLYLGGTLGESALGQRLLARGAAMDARGRITLPSELALPHALIPAARRAIRRHLAPKPQLALGAALGRLRRVAALDISDGLARDLHRLCRESAVGVEIDAAALPLAPGFAELCTALGEESLALALGGGEDYVLLFTLPSRTAPPPDVPCIRIGRITADRAIELCLDGTQRALPPLGWDHLG